jgi:hypothetical protein
MRPPSATSTAGSTSRVTAPSATATSPPPMPIEYRIRSGNTSRLNIAAATVRLLKNTVLPTVCSVRASAARVSAPPASSSR